MYSQNQEEAAILSAIGSITAGRYLDIGAWHPTALSNTRALYERGWTGVLVDPSPEPFLGLIKEYGNEDRITLICAAVGLERTMVRMHATADALTTSDQKNYERWKELGGFYGRFYSPQITLEELTNQFGGFDVVSIDAEGISSDLCLRYLSLGHRPACICVEHDGRIVEVSQVAHAAGYKTIYASGENLVFAR